MTNLNITRRGLISTGAALTAGVAAAPLVLGGPAAAACHTPAFVAESRRRRAGHRWERVHRRT